MDGKHKPQSHPKKHRPEYQAGAGVTVQSVLNNAHQKELEELKQANEKLQGALKDQEHKVLRLYADIDNLHKQHALEVSGARKTGKRSLAASVVELVNTINLSFSFVPADADDKFRHYVDTLRTSLKKAQSELDAVGLTLLIPDVGQEYDAHTMQALNASDKHTVVQVVSVGYTIDDQVVAPAVIMLG
jgi:molecular chaperone GrpE